MTMTSKSKPAAHPLLQSAAHCRPSALQQQRNRRGRDIEVFHPIAVGERDGMGAAGLKPWVKPCSFRSQHQRSWTGPIQLPVGDGASGACSIRHQRGHHLHASLNQLHQPCFELIQRGVFIGPEPLVRQLQQCTGGSPQHFGAEGVNT